MILQELITAHFWLLCIFFFRFLMPDMKLQVLLWPLFFLKQSFILVMQRKPRPQTDKPHFNWSLSSHCHLLAKNLNVKDILHDFILCFSLLKEKGLPYLYCCKKQVHWKHWIPQWRTGRGRCAHLCSGTCCHVSSTTSDHLHCMHLWESRDWSYKVTKVNHFLFPFLGRGDHSTSLEKPQRDIFSRTMFHLFPSAAACNWGRGEKADVSQ